MSTNSGGPKLQSRIFDWRWAAMVALIVVTVAAGGILRSSVPAQPVQATRKIVPTLAGQSTQTAAAQQPSRSLAVGMAFPRNGTTFGYSAADNVWQTGLPQLQQQTHVRWVELTLRLFQQSVTSTTVIHGYGTTSPQALAAGISQAHKLGLKVYVEPLLTVGTSSWGGFVSFSDPSQARAWFDGYWAVLQPYVQAASQAQVDQLSIGTELQDLEPAPPDDWNTLINRVHAIYHGPITYNMNWTSLRWSAQPWMRNPFLTYVGVSDYISLTGAPKVLSQDSMSLLWQRNVLPKFDSIFNQTGKQVVLSEIGFRNATDALVNPFFPTTTAPMDPQFQADAYSAALDAVYQDPHIAGIFFWGWDQARLQPSSQASGAIIAFCRAHTCS